MRKDVMAMEPRERVKRIVEVLRATVHHGFPVVDTINPPSANNQFPDYGRVKGLILRSQLITLLSNRVCSYFSLFTCLCHCHCGSANVTAKHCFFRDNYGCRVCIPKTLSCK